MSGDLTLTLRTIQSGLLANQAALNAVSNNVANVNSPGYSRRIVNLEHRVLAGTGAGVQVASLTRKVDQHLIDTVRAELSTLHSASAQQSYFSRLQDLFGSPSDNTSLSHNLSRFSAAVESLATTPEGALERQEVVRWGHEVGMQFQHMSATIQELRRRADVEIAEAVQEIQGLIDEIADLNRRVVSAGAVDRNTADLEDRRDLALDRLAELVDIRTFQRGDGDLVVFTTGGRVLVDSSAASVSHQAASSVAATTTYDEGEFGGIYVGSGTSPTDITPDLRGGRLHGLVELRDRVLPDLQSALDELASEIRDAVNAIHNRGTPAPPLQSMNGSRSFIRPGDQTVTLAGGGDVVIALFDSNGEETVSTTLETIMQSAAYGSGSEPANGPWDITEIGLTVRDWLQANGAPGAAVGLDQDNRLTIDLNAPSLHVAFRDDNATGAADDVTIAFDADGDGIVDETVQGFSYFFGFNDFYKDATLPGMFESDVIGANTTLSATAFTFHDSGGLLGTVAIGSNVPITDVVTAIRTAGLGVTASIVTDGAGVRLRIESTSGNGLTVTDGADTALADIGLHPAETGAAASLDVRPDLLTAPERVSAGMVQFDPNKGASGAYYVSVGDSTVAEQLAEALSTGRAFDLAGRMGVTTRTFEQYATAVLSDTASLADRNAQTVDFGSGLVESLQARSDQIRGVNLDEEMANLILYEQAYAAAAQVVGIVRSMFEALEQAVA